MSDPALSTLDSIALPAARRSMGKQGRAAAPKLPMAYVRDLGDGDIPALFEGLQSGAHTGVGSFSLTEMKARHHMLAMVLASGAEPPEAAFVTGYSIGTINTLKKSPMFIELLAYYQQQKIEEFKLFHQKAAVVGLDILEEIHRRVQESPDAIKFSDLKSAMDSLLDRTVLPSKSGAPAGGGATPPPPVTTIVFVDSPHAQAPAPADPRLIEGSYSKGPG